MLTELYGRLTQWLSAAGFTVYAEDAVPPGATFPYLTLHIEPTLSPCETGSITLTCWHLSSASHAERLAAADALWALVPTGGLQLTMQTGMAALFRRDSTITWRQSHGALGTGVRFDLLCCPGV